MRIWNHDVVSDRAVICGGTMRCVPAGAFVDVDGELGAEMMREAKRDGVPYSLEAPAAVVVGGEHFVSAKAVKSALVEDAKSNPTIPLALLDDDNLQLLRREALLAIAEHVGCPPLFSEETTKKEIIRTIRQFSTWPVPPTVTGAKQQTTLEEKTK